MGCLVHYPFKQIFTVRKFKCFFHLIYSIHLLILGVLGTAITGQLAVRNYEMAIGRSQQQGHCSIF